MANRSLIVSASTLDSGTIGYYLKDGTLISTSSVNFFISVSSSLLTATRNQKSSLREVPQFVSGVLTGTRGANNRSAKSPGKKVELQ
ncbi:hypothetical protein [Tardiphaga sp. 619_E2_N8_5]|uniref:hypothetical protein n=1 Tax=unclassified Tardiphaga TaxID=2631404 RepID=UPI003F28F57A